MRLLDPALEAVPSWYVAEVASTAAVIALSRLTMTV